MTGRSWETSPRMVWMTWCCTTRRPASGQSKIIPISARRARSTRLRSARSCPTERPPRLAGRTCRCRRACRRGSRPARRRRGFSSHLSCSASHGLREERRDGCSPARAPECAPVRPCARVSARAPECAPVRPLMPPADSWRLFQTAVVLGAAGLGPGMASGTLRSAAGQSGLGVSVARLSERCPSLARHLLL